MKTLEELMLVTTYEQVCKELNEKELTSDDFIHLPESIRVKTLTLSKLQQIHNFFNQGWKKDWSNSDEFIYYPYLYKSASGWVLRSYSGWCASSAIGFGFYSEELCNYVGNTFIELFNELI